MTGRHGGKESSQGEELETLNKDKSEQQRLVTKPLDWSNNGLIMTIGRKMTLLGIITWEGDGNREGDGTR